MTAQRLRRGVLVRSVVGAADTDEELVEAGDAAEQGADLGHLDPGQDVGALGVQGREVGQRRGERLVEAEVPGEADGLVGTIWP